MYSPHEDATFWMDVDCVNVEVDQAWFTGTVTEIDGTWTGLAIGQRYLYWVKDVATSGADGDLIGGIGGTNANCTTVNNGGFIGSGEVTAGNLKTHYQDES